MGHGMSRSHGTRATLTALSLCFLLLIPVGSAQAAPFEQIGCFAGSFPGLTDSCKPVEEEKFTEEVQLGGVSGMAVNYTGAGGVPKGTVYEFTFDLLDGGRVAMYAPAPDGGLEFKLAWEVTTLEEPYGRCGPALGSKCLPRVKGSPRPEHDVDVDEATGNVYVDNGAFGVGRNRIVVYKPDGSAVITRFGEYIGSFGGKTTAETPDKIHETQIWGDIAVNGAGEVYVFDINRAVGADEYHRLMKFVPKTPGNYSEYVYAGAGKDLAAGLPGTGSRPAEPVLDAAGNIYTTAGDEKTIEKYDASGSPTTPPVCKFTTSKGGITALTVNPETGEVFYFSYKTPKRLRRLGPCNPGTGKFAESEPEPEAIALAPERDDLYGLAFDPERELEGRPKGVLYTGAPGAVSSNGVGKGEPGQSSLGYVFAHPKAAPKPPVIEAQSVSHVTATSALLGAQINPEGFKTTYRFQYITQSAYEANPPGERFAGASEVPPGGASLGEGLVAIAAAGEAPGLLPDSEYRYRAVAESKCAQSEPEKTCRVEGEAKTLRTYPIEAPGLPDNRAYELVSPPDKQGGQVYVADPRIASCVKLESKCKLGETSPRFPLLSAAGGDAVTYMGTPFSHSEGSALDNAYIAHRDPQSGWQTTFLSPLLQTNNSGHAAYSSGLGAAVLGNRETALSSEAPAGYDNLYAQATAEPGALTPLITAQPPNRASLSFQIAYAGASADLSRVFFSANDALSGKTAFAPAAKDGGASKFNLYEWHEGQLALVNVKPGNAATEAGASFGLGGAHTISEDGSRAFWSSETGQVFVREGAKATLAIPGSGASAKFLAAATNGSKVLLTNGSLYDLEAKTSTDLTAGKGGFLGLLGQSDDLSHAYFVDSAVLDNAANGQGAKAEAGKPNLYSWSGGTARFVARLVEGGELGEQTDWEPSPVGRTAEASPAGRYLAFVSGAQLSGQDNTGLCTIVPITPTEPSHSVPGPCPEVFLYDSAGDELRCPSCNRGGAQALGPSTLRRVFGPATLPQARYLLDSGRLYFDSGDSLLPADSNEGVEDVYQYEPQGVGSCERAEGCVSLLSAGTGSVDSNLVTVDETGANVFFTTRDRLVLKDRDELFDLYDAREGGGIPGETETGREECQGEACQGPPVVPDDPTPASSGFEGSGNVTEPPPVIRKPCAKGKVKRRGKCVARKHRHHKRGVHRNGRKSR
jgi:hypothetical protein